MTVSETIASLPKTEIHVHGEAIVTYESYYALNVKNRVKPELSRPEDFHKLFDIKSLGDMIQNFLFLQTMFREPEDYVFLVKDVEKYCSANNIRYAELHISPSMVMRQEFVSFDDFFQVLDEGFDDLASRGGPNIKMLADLSRSFGPENARNNLNSLLTYRRNHSDTRIVGVGLGGKEEGNSCLDYKEILLEARAEGFHGAVHAGEEVDSSSIWDALNECGAERIGHGTSAVWDEKLMEYLKEKQIPLEVCPASNLVTKKYVQTYPEHPIYTFIDRGLNVTLNTDDPVLFNVDLNREYTDFLEAGKRDLKTAVKLLNNGIEASFALEEEKAGLRAELKKAADKLRLI